MKIRHIARFALDLLWKGDLISVDLIKKRVSLKKEGKIVSWSSEIRLLDPSLLLSSCVTWTNHETFCALVSPSGGDYGTHLSAWEGSNEIITCRALRAMLTHGKSSIKVHWSYYHVLLFFHCGKTQHKFTL